MIFEFFFQKSSMIPKNRNLRALPHPCPGFTGYHPDG